jgi:hypothetical protein
MYIETDKGKQQILSAYEDHKEIDEVVRPCVHIFFKNSEQANVLIGNSLAIYNDDGSELCKFESYDYVVGCEVVLCRQSNIEKELKSVNKELQVVKAERDALKQSLTNTVKRESKL